MLASLLEGEVDKDIVDKMVHSLDFEIMKNRMLSVFKRFSEEILGQENLDVKEIQFN